MRLKLTIATVATLLFAKSATSQLKQDVADYIAKYKNVAIEEMVRCHIPASITLAQGLHESSYGKSKLSTEANNHFGIKCKDEWEGKKFYQNDDAPNECFRVYDHAEDSYADHSDFLITRTRYAGLFELPITDYKAWAHGLKAAGYATNPKYAEILIKTIEDNNLTQYDELGQQIMAHNEKQLYPDNPPAPVAVKVEPAPDNTKTVLLAANTVPAQPEKPQPVLKESAVKRTSFPKASGTEFLTVHDNDNKKEFIINGCKAVKADGAIDPLAIAYNYHIEYSQILAFNDLGEGEKFKDGENIFLQSKRSRGNDATYVAQQGESMHDISQKFGVKLKDLYLKNQMTGNDQPYPGEMIALQEKRATPPRTMTYSDFLKAQSATTSSNNYSNNTAHAEYRAEAGDTLYSIAKKFNTTVQQIAALNNLNTADLHPGQTLVISK